MANTAFLSTTKSLLTNVFDPLSYGSHGVEVVWYVLEAPSIFPLCWFQRWSIDLYGIDLPPVSSIPGVKLTRQKNYDKYCIDIKALMGENKTSVVEKLHLDLTSEHQWLDSIQSWVTVLFSDACVADALQDFPQHWRLKSNSRYTVVVLDLVNMSPWQKRPSRIF